MNKDLNNKSVDANSVGKDEKAIYKCPACRVELETVPREQTFWCPKCKGLYAYTLNQLRFLGERNSR